MELGRSVITVALGTFFFFLIVERPVLVLLGFYVSVVGWLVSNSLPMPALYIEYVKLFCGPYLFSYLSPSTRSQLLDNKQSCSSSNP